MLCHTIRSDVECCYACYTDVRVPVQSCAILAQRDEVRSGMRVEMRVRYSISE